MGNLCHNFSKTGTTGRTHESHNLYNKFSNTDPLYCDLISDPQMIDRNLSNQVNCGIRSQHSQDRFRLNYGFTTYHIVF